jgi:hypothetical protein
VLQRAGQPEQAEARFRSGLAGAPADLHCRLEDVTPLLTDVDRSTYASLPCSDRGAVHARFWWLADPMFSVAGNERWTAHVARRFELILHEHIMAAVRAAHPGRHEDVIVRRGFEDSFDDHGRFTSRRAACCHFVPEVPVLGGDLESLRYRLAAEPDDEGFTPVHGPIVALPAQLARFLEGDSMMVAAVSDFGGTAGAASATLGAVLVLSDGPGRFPRRLEAAMDGARATVEGTVPPVAWAASLELLAAGEGVGRRRVGLMPLERDSLSASDVMLIRAGLAGQPAARSEALDVALGTTDVAVGEPVGLYWEIYGAPEGQAITTSLDVEGAPPGLLRRVAQALGIAGDPGSGGTVSWTEPSRGLLHRRALDLDIRSLEPGSYTLRLTFTSADGRRAAAVRRFQVGI